VTRVTVLGATGSVGRSTLDVLRSLGQGYSVSGLSAGSRWRELAQAVREFRPRRIALADSEAAAELSRAVDLDGASLYAGPNAATELVASDDADVVVSAIVGAAGLEPTLAAVRRARRVALANKESLVMAGPLLLREAARAGSTLLPVDSEHSAIFQAALSGRREEIRRVILTASGGPFRTKSAEELASVTAEEALRHPTWRMGPKITIDSATLMNKALEIIEARWLFDLDPARIEVWIHPQSVIHSMVEFVDGSVIAQAARADMRLPIQYALTYPERRPASAHALTIDDMAELRFERPDFERFPALELGYRAAREGGLAGAALNAANEVAAEAFLAGRCAFVDIARTAARVMDEFAPGAARAATSEGPHRAELSLERIWDVDRRSRETARRLLGLDDARDGSSAAAPGCQWRPRDANGVADEVSAGGGTA